MTCCLVGAVVGSLPPPSSWPTCVRPPARTEQARLHTEKQAPNPAGGDEAGVTILFLNLRQGEFSKTTVHWKHRDSWGREAARCFTGRLPCVMKCLSVSMVCPSAKKIHPYHKVTVTTLVLKALAGGGKGHGATPASEPYT